MPRRGKTLLLRQIKKKHLRKQVLLFLAETLPFGKVSLRRESNVKENPDGFPSHILSFRST